MKNLFLIIILPSLTIFYKAQTYPLRTFIQIPQNAYLKDTNDELLNYVETWKGSWNNKSIHITFKKITNQYNTNLKYYKDFLIGKFKVEDSNGQILFDNTSISDYDAKITGVGIRKVDDKYSLGYIDSDVCMDGSIRINFTDSTKTKLNWQFFDTTDIITPDCPYYNSNPFPQPLPANIVLTKQ